MKVLLITGQLAKDAVERYAKQSRVETEVYALNVAVAAFLTPKTIAQVLKAAKKKNFDLILVPGLVNGDVACISEVVETPAVKGSRYVADLPAVLDSLGEVKLSTTVPADELLRDVFERKALEEIEKTEQNREHLLKQPGSMLIGNLAVGKEFPMRVLGELVDASAMSNQAIQRLAKHFVEAGASMVDVGMAAGESHPEEAGRIVKLVKQAVDVPVSIDSLDQAEIKQAVQAGAELVLSGDAGNIDAIAPYVSDVAVVLIPTNQRQGYFPKNAQERVMFLEEIIAEAKKLGLKKYIADLILDPMNVLESFTAFRLFAQKNPSVPIFIGISNVTELIDADSVGVNALLARLSSEVGASILLATEKSDKAKGSVAEEAAAAKMMFLAKKRGSVPKDLGVDLLLLKDKRNREEPYDGKLEESASVVSAAGQDSLELDAKGSFKIFVDRQNHCIVATHYQNQKMGKPDVIVKGKTASAVCMKIVQSELASQLSHMAYLGSELAKAEIALRTGKEYIQDKAMFAR